jgi:hypothetical protein
VLLQKIYEGAHLRQKQAVSETMRDLPGWHSDEPGTCQSRTDQHIEVIGAKPGWNAQRPSHRAVLEAPFRHARYVAEGQAVLLDQVVRRRRLAAPAQIIRRGTDNKLDVVELADN